ncbi:MAG TPA: GTP cyclohydrolase II [Candidatus Limnocylindria bacterium]
MLRRWLVHHLEPVGDDRAEAALPTRYGDFRIAVFRLSGDETEVVALVRGDVRTPEPALVRLHSECLTGESLGSLRCDCGEQLEAALERIGRAGRGVLLYLRHEGRGIGLFDKIRAYALQDTGLDTVDANVALGLPVDAREYASAAAVLHRLGVRRARVLTNNPAKLRALAEHGVEVVERVPLEAAPNPVSRPYLAAKRSRMGHLLRAIEQRDPAPRRLRPMPFVTIHYAQTIDGRIASRTGDARWVSGEESLRLAHELRASHDAVLVGIGTVLKDDPRLTVRLVPGSSPVRVVVDSKLRIPTSANVLRDTAARTIIASTPYASSAAARRITEAGAEILQIPADIDGEVDLRLLLERLRGLGLASVLVEGGRGIITSILRGRLVDRLMVCIAPKVLGQGIEAVGDLHLDRLREALTFRDARFVPCGDDIIFDGELDRADASLRRSA